jgi:signal transduction histidine kinase
VLCWYTKAAIELKLKQTDINALLAHSVRLVKQDAQAENIEINLSASNDVPLIQVDSDRLSHMYPIFTHLSFASRTI